MGVSYGQNPNCTRGEPRGLKSTWSETFCEKCAVLVDNLWFYIVLVLVEIEIWWTLQLKLFREYGPELNWESILS